MDSTNQVTQLLQDWREGRKAAVDELVPLVYAELRKLAAGHLAREQGACTLEPTALIHEAYMRMVDQNLPAFQNRSHFFGVAANLMRQILVDHARSRRAAKRGGGLQPVTLDRAVIFDASNVEDMLGLDEALDKLNEMDPRKVKVLEMRYFGGLSLDEIAEATGISVPTVTRDLRMAEAFVLRELNPKP
jgi:RNA polymerase sigma factor (TIGR02999 family)